MEPLPRVFDMLQYFETILPSVENLWSSQQDEVYFMGGGAAGGFWRQQNKIIWSLSWLPSWILPRIRNQVKIAINGNFLCLTCKVTQKKALRIILSTGFTFIVEKSWKNIIFTRKWLYYQLLVTSYLVTIVTVHH